MSGEAEAAANWATVTTGCVSVWRVRKKGGECRLDPAILNLILMLPWWEDRNHVLSGTKETICI
jgi:hypothetical protein